MFGISFSGRHSEWHPPFVGAMKIARNVAVFGRCGEWYSPIPAPSLRELLSAAKLRECTSLNGKRNRFLSFRRGDENRPYPRILASTRLNGTSSRNFPAPSLREPGTPSSGRVPFTRLPGNHDVAGDFHRPYETQRILAFTIHRTTLPQRGSRDTIKAMSAGWWCIPGR